MKCIKCGAELSVYDIGFHKKLINRGAAEYMCIDCLCGHFRMTREKAFEMIRRFQKTGCLLFPPYEEENK